MFQLRRHCLENIEETKDQIILREKTRRARGTFFCVAGVLVGIGIGATWRAHHNPFELFLLGCVALYLYAFGLYALIHTTLTVSRGKGTLRVERK